jgi:hypothetical protein
MANANIKSQTKAGAIDLVGGSTTEAQNLAKAHPGTLVNLIRYDSGTGIVNLVVSYVYIEINGTAVLNTITPTVVIS